jgi:uncharacterized NAD(P)/FAD-binding protein YdhS
VAAGRLPPHAAPDPRQVCIVGAGPRGVSTLERICANASWVAPGVPVQVHLVDPFPPGPGRVWRTDQSRRLMMNTISSQVTLFTDESAELRGPVVRGPSLYQWAELVARDAGGGQLTAEDRDEAQRLGPDSYPTRAFYGRYLAWVFGRVVGSAPPEVTVTVHRTRAVAVDDGPDARQAVLLENGTRLDEVEAVVLAQGHLDVRPDPVEAQLAGFAETHGLTYVAPANPADVDLTSVVPRQPVVVRGLGLSFFDHLALLTTGRGGRFERRDTGLTYVPSGGEPRIYAGSRRGVPYHARGENQKGAHGRHDPQLLTASAVEGLRRRAGPAGLDFLRDVWPLVAAEVETVYHTTLLATRTSPRRGRALRRRLLAASRAGRGHEAALSRFGIGPAERWDWRWVADPCGAVCFGDANQHRTWLLEYLRTDASAARQGNVTGPLKAATDVLRDLRNEVRLAVDHGGLTGASHRAHLDGWYTPLNAFLSIGPPAARIEEMAALVEAGVLTVFGPRLQVGADRSTGRFVAMSATLPDLVVRSEALIEARLPAPDLRRTDDPLLRHLVATEQCTSYLIPTPGEAPFRTGAVAVSPRPYRVLDASGRQHPRRFAVGVPTEGVHWVTAAGIRPGVGSAMLADSDAVACAVLELTAARTPPRPSRAQWRAETVASGGRHE